MDVSIIKKKKKKDKFKEYNVIADKERLFIVESPLSTPKKRILDVQLNDKITSYPSYYMPLICLLRYAKKTDTINIHLNNHGGCIHTGIEIINTIKGSKADITAIVDSPCYSMAPIVALACPKIIMNDNTFLMFHDYHGGDYSNGHEKDTSTSAFRELMETALSQHCMPFLTKKEVHSIAKGTNLYIQGDDAKVRLAKHLKRKR